MCIAYVHFVPRPCMCTMHNTHNLNSRTDKDTPPRVRLDLVAAAAFCYRKRLIRNCSIDLVHDIKLCVSAVKGGGCGNKPGPEPGPEQAGCDQCFCARCAALNTCVHVRVLRMQCSAGRVVRELLVTIQCPLPFLHLHWNM